MHDVCLQNLPVVFCMDRAGLSGDDGPTHHGLFDIAYLRGVPNIVQMAPTDEDELADMMLTAVQHAGPSAIRYPRGTGPGAMVKEKPQAIPLGQGVVVQEGEDVAILGLGAMLPMARDLARTLAEQGYSAAVINPRFIKPLDGKLLARYARQAMAVVTFEDGVLMGGFGSAVMEALSEMGIDKPVVRIGWPDRFIEHGKPDQLRARHGISVEAALEKLAPHLKRTARRLVAQ